MGIPNLFTGWRSETSHQIDQKMAQNGHKLANIGHFPPYFDKHLRAGGRRRHT